LKQLKSKQTPLNLSLSGHLRLCLCLCQLCFSFFLSVSLFSLSVTFLISFPKSFFLLPIYHSLSIFFISFSLCILYIILYLYSLCDSLFVFLSLHQSIILIVSLPLLLSVFLSISIFFISFSLYLLYIISLHLLYIILSPSSLNHSLSVFFYLHRCITLIVSLPVFHSICISFYQSFYWSIHFVCSKSSLYPLSTFTSTSVPRHFFSPFIF